MLPSRDHGEQERGESATALQVLLAIVAAGAGMSSPLDTWIRVIALVVVIVLVTASWRRVRWPWLHRIG